MTSKILRSGLCAGLLLFAAVAAKAQNPVTFQVDMSQQSVIGAFIPGTSTVYGRGSFEGWGTDFPLTNNPAGANTNLYSGTYDVADAAGTVEQYKFYIDTGSNWENPTSTAGNNRTFTLAGGAQTLPVVYFNDLAPAPTVTNDVTFNVDMSAQILTGKFIPGTSTVFGRGSFEGWGTDFPLTNNPAAANTNVYSGVYTISATAATTEQYKYYIDTGNNWESPISTGGNNRSFNLLTNNGPLTLPLVFFNDQALTDLLPVDTDVTFTINMTNAVGTDTHAFDPTADTVWINGDFLGWWSWGAFPPAQYQMTNNPVGSGLYTLTLTIPKGNALSVVYKYSINGPDNEAGFAQNHARFIRNIKGGYQMPTDTFGNQFTEPLYATRSSSGTIGTAGFGNLQIGLPSAGHATVSWAGLPGVHLQTASSLNGLWADHFETDGTNWTAGTLSNVGFISQTNFPTSGSAFFRLSRPQ
jgi:hypothetical protein